jgi:hypothetical protein
MTVHATSNHALVAANSSAGAVWYAESSTIIHYSLLSAPFSLFRLAARLYKCMILAVQQYACTILTYVLYFLTPPSPPRKVY